MIPRAACTRVGTQNFSTANDPDYRDPQTQQWSLTFERELDRRNALRLTYSGNPEHGSDAGAGPQPDSAEHGRLRQPAAARHGPIPNWFRVNTRDNGGYHHYHDVLVQLQWRHRHGPG